MRGLIFTKCYWHMLFMLHYFHGIFQNLSPHTFGQLIMRICFSIQNNGDDDLKLSDHFGESERFVIFDTRLGTIQPHECDSALCRGPCRCYVPTIPESGFDAVICRSIGARVFNALRRNGINVYLTSECTMRTALNVWQTQELHVANKIVCRPEHVASRRERHQSKVK